MRHRSFAAIGSAAPESHDGEAGGALAVASESAPKAPPPGRVDLARYVEALPPRMKASFILFAVEEFTQEEVARILDISVGSVKVNVHRARQKLRDWLAVSPGGGKA